MIVGILLMFIVGISVLLVSSDKLLEKAEKIGKGIGMSPVFTGILLLGFGTSLPELITSLLAAVKGDGNIVLGNVTGSNITNILLVLGVAALLGKNFIIPIDVIRKDIAFLVASGAIMYFAVVDGIVTATEALFMLFASMFYIDVRKTVFKSAKEVDLKINDFILFVLSLTSLYIAASITIDAIIKISEVLGRNTFIISAILLALSTSLPELLVSSLSALRGKVDLSVGNIIGSNIFNSLIVLSVPALLNDLIFTDVPLFSISFMLFSIFLFYTISLDRRISKQEASIMILFYFFYAGKVAGII